MSDGLDVEHDVVIVFAKVPIAGEVKTRLTPPLSEAQAAALYTAFMADTALTVARYGAQSSRPLVKVVAVAGDSVAASAHAAFAPFVDAGFVFLDQGEGNLGERLRRISGLCLEQGAARVVVIGTDSPTLHVDHIEFAFTLLSAHDVVLGPSFDGGYYLIGLRQMVVDGPVAHEVVFENIAWSTGDVLAQTWERCKSASLLCELMGFWYDVDTFEDVKMLRFHLLKYLKERDSELAPNTVQLLDAWQLDGAFGLSG
ncbi:MAG: TIGR04282 family arsenosugar biosynthesis glycosyltransferase [Bradymonadaceae bacterium]|nr:TIGR04282 family arsenosugar biosynthesis glycosyltransferase [Lujinxingiaceae bacterium]